MGITSVQFDPDNKVLCDEQGIMHSKATVEALFNQCLEHLEHSDLELIALGRMFVERRGKSYALQFNFDEFYP